MDEKSSKESFAADPELILRQFLQMLLIAHDQPGSYIRNYASCKVDTARSIERNRNHATQHAAKERCLPLGRICTPKQNAFAGRNATIRQHARETSRQCCQFGVGRRDTPIAGIADDGDLFAVPLKIFDESGEMLSHDGLDADELRACLLRQRWCLVRMAIRDRAHAHAIDATM